MSEVSVGQKYSFMDTEVTVTYVNGWGQVGYEYDDLSFGLAESVEEFLFEFEKVETVDGWLTVVRDNVLNSVYFLDVVHVTRKNAETAFYRDGYDKDYELVGFQYVTWDGYDRH